MVRDLVLLGAGHSHVAVLRRFGERPLPGVRLTLITHELHTPYSGMLPGLIAGHYRFADAHIDVRPLARFAGADLYQGEAIGLDLPSRRVLCHGRPPVPFDLLSIDVGAAPDPRATPGAAESAVAVKPISSFLARWDGLVARVIRAGGSSRIAVVGAGAGGVELLLAAQYRLGNELRSRGLPTDRLAFTLLGDTPRILPAFPAGVQRWFARLLERRGVRVVAGRPVERVVDRLVYLQAASPLEFDEILWVTSAASQPWPGASGLGVDEAGFIVVDDCLRSLSHPFVFAAGDTATMARHPRPKSGVFAVRQGAPLADNLRRALAGRPGKPFAPQRKALSVISTGDRCAVATRGNWWVAGRFAWRWKDWIDRRFMARYQRLGKPTSWRNALSRVIARAMRKR